MIQSRLQKTEIVQQLSRVVLTWEAENQQRHHYSPELLRLILSEYGTVLQATSISQHSVLLEFSSPQQAETAVASLQDQTLGIGFKVSSEKRTKLQQFLERLETRGLAEESPLTVSSENVGKISRLVNGSGRVLAEDLERHAAERSLVMQSVVREELNRP